MNITIRSEEERDIEAIHSITIEAFKTVAISNKTEQFIIKALRRANALSVSLVAEVEDTVIGHIAFSPIVISDGSTDWYTLGPISVKPAFQKNGVGGALIEKGISMVKKTGGRGCLLVGDPKYYSRYGFKTDSRLSIDGVPPDVLLVQPFFEPVPEGKVQLHEGFWSRE